MAKVNATFELTQGGGFDEIERLLAELNVSEDSETPPAVFAGALTVTGHSYWVVLEYGSSPRTPNAGPSSSDIVQLEMPKGINRPKHHTRYYPIRPRHADRLVFFDHRVGRKVARRIVHHPGIVARGFIRRAIQRANGRLFTDLKAIAREETLPDREDLVKVLNTHLMYLLQEVISTTPVKEQTDEDGFLLDEEDSAPGGLQNAWGVNLAK